MGNPTGEKQDSTEQRIFEAAHVMFTQKGLDGAKMQDIADRAGINKALLHYYYRSKEKLYEAVVKVVLSKAVPAIRKVLESDLSLHDKIERFIDTYISVIKANPFVPLFIISEINKHPERFFDQILPQDLPKPQVFFQQVEEAAATGKIVPIKPRHLLANIVSLCIFPFIGKPMMRILMGMSTAEMKQFLDERKTEVKTFVFNALRPQ